MSQNVNQFGMTKDTAVLDLTLGLNNSMACYFGTDSAELLPGEAVKLIDRGTADVAGLNPVVGKRASAADAEIFGLCVRSKKSSKAETGDIVDIALPGSVLNLVATGAMNRGKAVSADFANPGQVIAQAAGTGPKIGTVLDKATQAGDIVRVLIEKGPAL